VKGERRRGKKKGKEEGERREENRREEKQKIAPHAVRENPSRSA
jgi:hypothetical protein